MSADFCEASTEGNRQIRRIMERQNLSYADATNRWMAKQQPPKPSPAGGFDRASLDADEKIRAYAFDQGLTYVEAADILCDRAQSKAKADEVSFNEAFHEVIACV